MPRDASPNGDAPAEHDLIDLVSVGLRRRVSEMQANLHHWRRLILAAGSSTCSPTLGPSRLNQAAAETMESPVR